MSNGFQKSFVHRFESGLERLEKRKWLLLVFFLTIYFAGFFIVAAKGVITNDELFTLYIARLPSLHDVWRALATGVEQTPPLVHIVTRADIALLGTSPLTIRLPEILAFAVMCLCLFQFVSRRSSVFYGFIAMLVPLMTAAFNYVYFARAYALVLGFSAVALLCWQWAAENQHRTVALVGFGGSLAAAVSSHYYAVLTLFPLGLGELVRSIRRKKIDLGIWLALILSLLPLLAFLPLIESARKFAPHFWSKPHWSSIIFYYPYSLLSPSAIPLLVILAVIVAHAAVVRPAEAAYIARERSSIPVHEVAAALGFLLIPMVGVVLGKTVVGAYEDRCALPAVIGLSIAIAWGLYSEFEARLIPAFGLGLLLCLYLVVRQAQCYRREGAVRSEQASTFAFLENYAKGSYPIAFANSSGFTELNYDAPVSIGRRLIYLADPQMGLRYRGTDDVERGLVEMKHWARLDVQPFSAFVASRQKCYVLYLSAYPHDFSWIIQALKAAHWGLTLVRWKAGKILFLATPGPKEEFSSASH